MFLQLKQAFCQKLKVVLFLLFVNTLPSNAQTDIDAIMMGKNLFCTGIMYNGSNWDQYWEGTLKRENANLGTVSTNMIGPMGSLGISSKLNVIFNLPYVSTNASAGQLRGFQGFQVLSLWLKW
jgi:hypothetical protein